MQHGRHLASQEERVRHCVTRRRWGDRSTPFNRDAPAERGFAIGGLRLRPRSAGASRSGGEGGNPTSCVARRHVQTSVGVAGATSRRGTDSGNPRRTRCANPRSPLAPASVAQPSIWSVFRPRCSSLIGSLGNVSPGRGSLELLHRAICVDYRKWTSRPPTPRPLRPLLSTAY